MGPSSCRKNVTSCFAIPHQEQKRFGAVESLSSHTSGTSSQKVQPENLSSHSTRISSQQGQRKSYFSHTAGISNEEVLREDLSSHSTISTYHELQRESYSSHTSGVRSCSLRICLPKLQKGTVAESVSASFSPLPITTTEVKLSILSSRFQS